MKTSYISRLEKFKWHLLEEEKSPLTIEKYLRDVNAFFKWLDERELSKKSVLEYKEELILHFAPASVNSYLSSLNSFFIYIERYDLKVKTLKIQKQLFIKSERELDKSEYERLLDTAKRCKNERLWLIMQTICSTGIRVSELQYITISAVREEKAVISCKGKMRVVFIPAKLCKMLLKYAAMVGIRQGSIFVTRSGKPCDRSNIWQEMKKLCTAAGVDKNKVFPHNLRHLFARTYYSIKRDIVRLADILGHSSVNTTRIYTMETGDVHRRHIQQLGLLRC